MTSASAPREAFAAAKVNLFLHVGPPQPDGYHPIASLFVFADVGDRLALRDEAGPPLAIGGPFGGELSAGPDNLVIRAAEALSRDLAVGLKLEKHLPLAAGLGGGSADAAATLRLLNPLLPEPRAAAELTAIAARLGADVAACLESRPVMATGRGDQLSPAPRLPVLHAVLVNPGVESPTGPVYRAYDQGVQAAADGPDMPESLATARDVADLIDRARNDLEAPAVRLAPEIGTVLDVLRAAPETLAARMSGSGATSFALCPGAAGAEALAARLAAAHPRWWVRACRLGGPWT
ncbi:MAG TPA: 4-(cytidine 5'-diphospho)-2-C-methyl-D-erythritol kinase [Caulobacteraceae bacterium]|jgi:4-diphosphocytidyl-2-C-methyl-D-erythritol kinase|nr:4-(cytidine 5'-diphospho)-2-C-methyl-D-erythritol kinase [Caulobacteraceae bacterium]